MALHRAKNHAEPSTLSALTPALDSPSVQRTPVCQPLQVSVPRPLGLCSSGCFLPRRSHSRVHHEAVTERRGPTHGKAPRSALFVAVWFVDHTKRYSRPTLGSEFRGHFWWGSGNYMKYWGLNLHWLHARQAPSLQYYCTSLCLLFWHMEGRDPL